MFGRIFLLLSAFLWTYLFITGISGYYDIVAQRVPDFPNNSQIYLYIVIPGGILLLSVFGIGFYNSTKYKGLVGVFAFMFAISSLPYILIARGGV
jgi:hypothetical protein